MTPTPGPTIEQQLELQRLRNEEQKLKNEELQAQIAAMQQTHHSKWMSFFHALAVIAPVGAAAFSIYSGSPADAQKAQQTAQLIAGIGNLLGTPQP